MKSNSGACVRSPNVHIELQAVVHLSLGFSTPDPHGQWEVFEWVSSRSSFISVRYAAQMDKIKKKQFGTFKIISSVVHYGQSVGDMDSGTNFTFS